MREIEEERCVRGHEEYRESEGKKGVGPFTNCDKEKDRAGEKESEILTENREFAINIGLYEKYIHFALRKSAITSLYCSQFQNFKAQWISHYE